MILELANLSRKARSARGCQGRHELQGDEAVFKKAKDPRDRSAKQGRQIRQ